MSEFMLGYTAGIGTSIVAALLIYMLVSTIRICEKDEPEPEQQNDIRLTKIKSEHVRAYWHD
jgi:hypothetical protein